MRDHQLDALRYPVAMDLRQRPIRWWKLAVLAMLSLGAWDAMTGPAIYLPGAGLCLAKAVAYIFTAWVAGSKM